MATPRKKFELEIKTDWAGQPTGVVILKCIAYLYHDGTFKSLDINEALFNGRDDVAQWVCSMQPEMWEEWETAAEDHFKELNEEPAPVEHD